jgi:predicted MFS family arabinose efflux permease
VTLAAAAASAMVIANTPVLVQAALGLGQREVAITLAAFGGGSMLAALLLPRLLDKLPDRTVMLAAASAMTTRWPRWLSHGGHASPGYWSVIRGVGGARHCLFGEHHAGRPPVTTIVGRSGSARPVRRAVRAQPCVLARRLSAGWLTGAQGGMGLAFAVAAALSLIGVGLAFLIWPKRMPTWWSTITPPFRPTIPISP